MEEINCRRQRTKQQYGRTAKELPAPADGQIVRIQPVKQKDQWIKATALKKVSARSYLVKAANGQIYRRNRKHFRHTNEVLTSTLTMHQGAEDESAIPTTITSQQTHENEQVVDSNE